MPRIVDDPVERPKVARLTPIGGTALAIARGRAGKTFTYVDHPGGT